MKRLFVAAMLFFTVVSTPIFAITGVHTVIGKMGYFEIGNPDAYAEGYSIVLDDDTVWTFEWSEHKRNQLQIQVGDEVVISRPHVLYQMRRVTRYRLDAQGNKHPVHHTVCEAVVSYTMTIISDGIFSRVVRFHQPNEELNHFIAE